MPVVRGCLSSFKRLERLGTLRATIRLLYGCHPRAFIISCFASLPEPLFYPAILIVLHLLLQNVMGPGGTTQFSQAVAIVGLGLVGLFMVQRLGIILRDSSSTILRQQAWVVISKQIMQKIPDVPYPLFENNAFQARYGLVIREAAQRSITLVDSLLSTAPIFAGMIAVAVTLFTLAPLLVVAVVLIIIPAGLIERRFSHAMYELQESNAPNQLRIEVLTNMQVDAASQRDVRVYQSNLIQEEHARLAETYLSNLKELTRRFAGLRTLAVLVECVGIILALGALGLLISHQQIGLPTLAVILPGVAWFTGMLRSGIYQGRSLHESLNYAKALFAFLAEDFTDGESTEMMGDGHRETDRTGASPVRRKGSYTYPENGQTGDREGGWGLPPSGDTASASSTPRDFDIERTSRDSDAEHAPTYRSGDAELAPSPDRGQPYPSLQSPVPKAQRLRTVVLSQVSYTYPENQKQAIIELSCTFTPGLTAIVGTNGAGKSTLVKLLTGLVPPTAGTLVATLETGEQLPLAAVAKAVLFQDPSHFHFSIRQNVTMQSERLPGEEERIEQVLRQAGLWEEAVKLPDGIDTIVGAGFGGSADLSGGQWQRLALARLLYHNSPLIILDEPTASLDPVGERQIFQLLSTFAKEKIILFTTHRYDTIRQADTILVLLDGRLAEMGTHEELASNAREFWSLYLAQGSVVPEVPAPQERGRR